MPDRRQNKSNDQELTDFYIIDIHCLKQTFSRSACRGSSQTKACVSLCGARDDRSSVPIPLPQQASLPKCSCLLALQQWHLWMNMWTSPLWLRMAVNSLVEVSSVDISCVLCLVIPFSVCIFLPVFHSCWYSAQSYILEMHKGWKCSSSYIRDLWYLST